MIPNKIYIPTEYTDNDITPVGVTLQQVFPNDVCYIRKDALVEWAKERYKTTISNVGCYTGHSVWAEVIEYINEM